MPSGDERPSQLQKTDAPTCESDVAYALWQQRADDLAVADARVRARQLKLDQLLRGQKQVIEAGVQLLAALEPRFRAAAAAAGTAPGSSDRPHHDVVQQALRAAAAPAAGLDGGGLGDFDGFQMLLHFAAALLPEVFSGCDQSGWTEALQHVYKQTNSPGLLSTTEDQSTPGQLIITARSRISKKFNAEEQVCNVKGTTPWNRDSTLNHQYNASVAIRNDGGEQYVDSKVVMRWDSGSRQRMSQIKGAADKLLLLLNVAVVAGVFRNKLPDSEWGDLVALLDPSAAAAQNGRIVGSATGLTKAVAKGVDLLAPVTTEGC
jgi:hypothetical protein